jgi:hypothetical protein
MSDAVIYGAPTPADDLLRGVKKIAEFTGESDRRALYLLESGHLPGGKSGRIWIASKRVLSAHYARLTGGAPA